MRKPHSARALVIALFVVAVMAGLSTSPLLVAGRAADSCTAPSFRPAPAYAVGADTRSVATGDFNEDGKPDVVTASVGTDTVSVLLNDGTGALSNATAYPVGQDPISVATGDFNGDGSDDIVTANNASSNVSVLLSDGAGIFGAASSVAAGTGPRALAVGDFNGDGRRDLAVVNESGSISILRGNGAGGFTAPTNVPVGSQPKSVAVADFNSDGKSDLIFTANSNASVLLGNGAGGFAAPSCGGNGADAVAVGDFNNDGKPDFAGVTPLNGNVSVYLNSGAGCFEPARTFNGATTPGANLIAVAAADLNGDGKADLIASTGDSRTSVLLGDGAGSFGAPKAYAPSGSRIAVADFNSDGRSDAAVVSDRFLLLLFGDGAGGFAYSVGGDSRFGAAGDFNGDGKTDLAVANASRVLVLPGDGAGGFGQPTVLTVPATPISVAAADFNSDGKLDLAVASTNNPPVVSILLGDGAGSFGAPSVFSTGQEAWAIGVGDLNGDGKTDVVTAHQVFQNVSVLLGDGAGGLGAVKKFQADLVSNPTTVAIADLNGDGKADFALPGFQGVAILFGDGAGNFGEVNTVASGTAAQAVVVRDMNGDGKPDMVFANANSDVVSVVFGDGAGGFSAPTGFAIGGRGQHLTVRDFNGDGLPDVAATAQIFGGNAMSQVSNVTVLLNNGSGGLTAPAIFPVFGVYSVISTDFNKDLRADLLTVNSGGSISMLLNTCPAISHSQSSLQFGASGYEVSEGAESVTVEVTRAGDLDGATSVSYSTASGTASDRSDFTATLGTLRFAGGEASKSFKVLLTDDGFAGESGEAFSVSLSNPVGGNLGSPASVNVVIIDNDATVSANPVDNSEFFVRQHYHDFLNREPDAPGLAFWTGQIEGCGSDQPCREVKRINASAAFFLSIEFQETGYLVYRMHKSAYGDATSPNVPGTVPLIRLAEFLSDAPIVGQGVIIGQPGAETLLEANKQAYVLAFVQRQRFKNDYPVGMSAEEFVNKLNQNAGLVLSPEQQSALIAELSPDSADPSLRASVIRKVAEDADLARNEKNRAFVLMQFYGYLRRNPDDPQDVDFRGWRFWLDKLEEFNGNFVHAEMVKSFITSTEYRQRFGQP